MIEDVYALSPLQSGIYYHWITSDNPSLYFQQMCYKVQGEIHLEELQKSFQMIIDRYPILRTVFTREVEDELLQVVKKTETCDFTYLNYSNASEADVEEFKKQDREKGFDLESGPLMRLTVLQTGTKSFDFIWSYHHILMDGWCNNIITKEFFEVYFKLVKGTEIQLDKIHPYANYIQWLDTLDQQKSLNYWENYLVEFNSQTSFEKKTKKEYQNVEPAVSAFTLAQSKEIAALCEELEITENVFLQALWGTLLAKHTNSRDAIFGMIVSGRPPSLDGIETMIGLFINTIPVRVKFDAETSFKELLQNIQAKSLESLDHHYLKLSDIQSKSSLKRGLFDHVLVFEDYPVVNVLEGKTSENNQKGTSTESDEISVAYAKSFEQTNYDLALDIFTQETTEIRFNYNPKVYDEAFIKQLQAQLTRIIKQIIANPAIPMKDIIWISEEEEAIINKRNDTDVEFDHHKTVLDRIEEQAIINPNNIAVVYGDIQLSFKELNEKANVLAHYLKEQHQIGEEDLVGIMFDRSEMMVVCMLALFKLAAVYVPIDPDFPQARIEYISDSCKLVIEEDFFEKLNTPEIQQNTHNTGIKLKPNNLAYIIFTSGTTGKPKGAMIEHVGMTNHILAKVNDFQVTDKTIIAQNSSQCFDISVWQALTALVVGGKTIIYDKNTILDPVHFFDLVDKDKITILELVPSYLSIFFELTEAPESTRPQFKSMEYMILNGETLPINLMKLWFENYTHIPVANAYGPTEASDDVTHYITDVMPDCVSIPLGTPIQNFAIYVLDNDFNYCPIGVRGEIIVSGIGVGRGYLNEPELTNKAYLDDPHVKGKRMYRTGDVGKWTAEGYLEFYGRKDYQVKINGHRIEMEEIEVNLNKIPEIKQAIVVDKKDHRGELVLAAYYTVDQEIDKETIRKKLREKMPSYMVPSYLVELKEFSLTPNGKTDRKYIKNLDLPGEEEQVVNEVLNNEKEAELMQLWKTTLNLSDISIDNDFFDLGGDSFKAIRLVAKSKNLFTVNDLYNNPTIKKLAAFLIKENKTTKEANQNVLEQLIKAEEDVHVSVVSVPNSAGEPFSFRDIAIEMQKNNPHVAYFGVELPRRRMKEGQSFDETRKELINEIVTEIQKTITGPVLIYGQCNGSALAMGIADELRNRNAAVVGLCIGAMLMPETPSNEPDRRSETTILDFLEKLGGNYPKVSPDKEFFISNYKYDTSIGSIGFYQYRRAIERGDFPKFDFPIHFITGDKDPVTVGYQEKHKEWEAFTNTVKLYEIPNVGHYLPRDAAEEMARIFNEVIKVKTNSLV